MEIKRNQRLLHASNIPELKFGTEDARFVYIRPISDALMKHLISLCHNEKVAVFIWVSSCCLEMLDIWESHPGNFISLPYYWLLTDHRNDMIQCKM